MIYTYIKNCNPSRLLDEVKAQLSSVDHIETNGSQISIFFPSEINEETLANIVTAHQASNTEDYITRVIKEAEIFGRELIDKISVENVLMGITQSGKTGIFIDYTIKVLNDLKTGSLHSVIQRIDILINDSSQEKTNLSPFITNDRLTLYKNKIQDYLGVPRT